VPLRGLEITGNLFVGSGAGAVYAYHTEGAIIRDNLILRPFVGNGLLPSKGAPEPIVLKNHQGSEIVGNRTITDSPGLAERLAQRMRQHEESAAAILKDVRAETSGK
jgi:hypothetical protein